MKNNIIEIEHLTKRYGKHRGVTNVTLAVQEGDIFGFLGPNGAGKSTTIRSILGFLNYEEGKIQVCGLDSIHDHEAILKNVGYIPSEAWFYPEMTVNQLLQMSADVRKVDCRAEKEMLCEKLEMDVNRKINELSLGNRKKVSIICAMQHKPKLFIFDEPTSGLDPLMQNTFFELLSDYVKMGATCMLSTHVLSEVRNYCNKVGMMKEGLLLCTDSVENLTKSSAKRIRMIRNKEKLDYLYKGNMNDIYKELAGYDIQDLLIEEPSIEEIFMHYYKKETSDVNNMEA